MIIASLHTNKIFLGTLQINKLFIFKLDAEGKYRMYLASKYSGSAEITHTNDE